MRTDASGSIASDSAASVRSSAIRTRSRAAQGGLFLRAGDRDAEQVVALPLRTGAGVGGNGTQDVGDLPLAERFAIDTAPADRLGVLGQQLHRADAVAADRLASRDAVIGSDSERTFGEASQPGS